MTPIKATLLTVLLLIIVVGGYALIRSGEEYTLEVPSSTSTSPSSIISTSTLPIATSSPTLPKPNPEPVLGKCFVGGCSGQVCSDEPGAVSTCEYKPEYLCYKQAVCERQPSGHCGWTETAAFNTCIQSPHAL
jgi:hypothetical protein